MKNELVVHDRPSPSGQGLNNCQFGVNGNAGCGQIRRENSMFEFEAVNNQTGRYKRVVNPSYTKMLIAVD